MKLVTLALATILATACYAQAEPAPVYGGPPGGYAVVPVAPVAAPPPVEDARLRPAANGELRAEILAHFDRNGDGQLDPRELRQAIRTLHRIEHQLRQENRRERRAERIRERQGERPQPAPPRPEYDPGF